MRAAAERRAPSALRVVWRKKKNTPEKKNGAVLSGAGARGVRWDYGHLFDCGGCENAQRARHHIMFISIVRRACNGCGRLVGGWMGGGDVGVLMVYSAAYLVNEWWCFVEYI